MRENRLSNRVFESYEQIVDLCCDAWNRRSTLAVHVHWNARMALTVLVSESSYKPRTCLERHELLRRWIPTRSATPSTALVPQRKVGFPIPNPRLLLGFQGTKTARREGISSPFSDAGGCTSRRNSGATTSQKSSLFSNHPICLMNADGTVIGLAARSAISFKRRSRAAICGEGSMPATRNISFHR
jgi:hypothetical protein